MLRLRHLRLLQRGRYHGRHLRHGWLVTPGASAPPHGVSQGRALAESLRGAWRRTPSLPDLSAAAVGESVPALLRTGSAALVWWRLRRTDCGLGPELLGLKHAYQRHTLEHEIHERRLPAAVSALRSHGIHPLLGKGWAIARLYPEPGLRPYVDLDLYVASAEHAGARTALVSSGAGAGVDLHRGASDLDDRSFADLRARSVTATVGDVVVRLFGPEDHLRLLCLHFLRHGGAKPLWLCDVAVMLEAHAATFDWDVFLSGDARRTKAAVCVLGLARELLGADLAGSRLSPCLPSWLVPALLEQWARRGVRREPIASALFRPGGLEELARHWPNALEASYGIGAPFNEWPRLPFQLALVAVRAMRLSLAVPLALWRRTRARSLAATGS